MVETTVDLDELENHQFIIKPDFDDDLRELKNALLQNREQLDEEHERVAKDLGMGTDSKILHFENHQVYGYVFRLTRKVLIQFELLFSFGIFHLTRGSGIPVCAIRKLVQFARKRITLSSVIETMAVISPLKL